MKNRVHISTAVSTNKKIVIALYSYDAEGKSEVAFKKGEKLVILDE